MLWFVKALKSAALMFDWLMVFRKAVSIVVSGFAPVDAELVLQLTVDHHKSSNLMSMDLERCCLTVSLVMPAAVLLSVTMTVGNCGFCILMTI